MDRLYLLAPALTLAAAFFAAFFVYALLHAIGRGPRVTGIKHNELLGPFTAGFLYWLVLPLERLLVGRVSPNVITSVSLVLCGLCGVAAALGHLPAAVWLFAFAGILDILDGRIARLGGRMTKAGALFDSVSDRWGEMFVFAGYAWYLHRTPWMLAALGAFGGSMMVSYTRARAEALHADAKVGFGSRPTRVMILAAGLILSGIFGYEEPLSVLSVSVWILAAISLVTTVQRILAVRTALNAEPGDL